LSGNWYVMIIRDQRPSSREIIILGSDSNRSYSTRVPLSESPETRVSIHKQGLTGNESRCVAGKKHDRGSNLTRMRESPHRHSAQIPGLAFAALRIVRAKQLCFGRVWRDGIRGDAVGCEL
jgi:hypothetical protein